MAWELRGRPREPQDPMLWRALCPICELELAYVSGDESGQLLKHLHEAHSQVSVAAFRVNASPRHPAPAEATTTPVRIDIPFLVDPTTVSASLQRTTACPFREEGSRPDTTPQGRWARGPGRMRCHSCGSLEFPLAKQQTLEKQTRKRSGNSLGSLLVCPCWRCCVPARDKDLVILFCPSCSHYLATYDAEDGTLRRPPMPADVTKSASESSVESQED